jgi:N6-L-threonylcarbamoyladenine synthase
MTAELVLGIESSCDETAAAVVRGGRAVLSSIVHSQAPEHALFGGVVPEIAGRSHLRHVIPVIDEALEASGVGLERIDAIAVTARPGLIGSLLVGLSAGKALAFARGLPLVCVDHIQAHAYAATMEHDVELPCLALVVSGGHTALYRMDSATRLARLATTRDDAAGEAFDKVAQMLGLGYPGGPEIARLARSGDGQAIAFPRYRAKDGAVDFSFSGLKTAVLYHLRGQDALAPTPAPRDIQAPADVAASFQEAVVDVLVRQSLAVAEAEGLRTVLVTGGVACNARLRERMSAAAAERGIAAVFPSPAYCSDNAAMIAGLGTELLRAGELATLHADASPR